MALDLGPAATAGPASTTGSPRRWLILVVVSFAQFMAVLDATVVNVMLPELQRSIGLSTTGMQWVMSIYVLMLGGFMLLGGRLTDVVGRRRVFLAGLALFTLSSLAAGMAQSEAQLLVARAVQGIGAAAVSPATLSILVTSFPDPKERAKAFGIWGTVLGIGASVGTLLGGAVVEIGWRWAFYVNVPVGVLLAVAAVALVPGGAPAGPRPKSDVGGAITVTAGLLALVYGIVGTSERGWTDPVTVASFAAAAVLLTAFVRIEHASPAPLVPLRLFRQRGVVAGSLGQLLVAGLMLPCFFLLPVYMQTVLGYGPLKTGIAYLPTSLALMIVASIVSGMIGRTGARLPFVLGTGILGVMLLLLTRTTVQDNYWGLLFPVTLLLGVGLVLCLISAPIVGTSQATEEDAGTTSALLNSSTEIGGALGLAVAATVVQARAGALVAAGVDPIEALNQGLHRGFVVLLVWVGLSAIVGIVGFRGLGRTPVPEEPTGLTERQLAMHAATDTGPIPVVRPAPAAPAAAVTITAAMVPLPMPVPVVVSTGVAPPPVAEPAVPVPVPAVAVPVAVPEILALPAEVAPPVPVAVPVAVAEVVGEPVAVR